MRGHGSLQQLLGKRVTGKKKPDQEEAPNSNKRQKPAAGSGAMLRTCKFGSFHPISLSRLYCWLSNSTATEQWPTETACLLQAPATGRAASPCIAQAQTPQDYPQQPFEVYATISTAASCTCQLDHPYKSSGSTPSGDSRCSTTLCACSAAPCA